MTTSTAYLLLVALVALERLLELRVSNRNVRRLLAQGAIEEGASHYPAMVAVHTLFLLSCALEVLVWDRPFIPLLGFSMLTLLAATMAIRYWVIVSLRGRWNTRVVYVPGAPRVADGPYRWLRHPNYLAVVLELIALPLIHGAWITAVVFSVANVFVLRARIGVENRVLERYAGSESLARGAS